MKRTATVYFLACAGLVLATLAYYEFSPLEGGHKPCLFKAGDLVKFKGFDNKFVVYDSDWGCRVTAINELLEPHIYDEEYFEKAGS
jgi:hypothetical protein